MIPFLPKLNLRSLSPGALASVCAVLLLTAGCSTLGGAFGGVRPDYKEVPEEELRQLARQIERTVALGDRDAVIESTGGLVVDTPELQQAIRSRAARVGLVSALLDSGHAWERRNGLIDIQRTRAYKEYGTSRDRDRNALMVLSENEDRWTIYEGIVKASGLRPKARGAVQLVFHEERLNVMEPGQKFENAQGSESTIAGVRPKGEASAEEAAAR